MGKSNKLIIIVIVLGVLLVISCIYNAYSYTSWNSMNKLYLETLDKYENSRASEKKDTNSTKETNYITISDIGAKKYNYSYNYYAYGFPATVIGYKGDLYEIEATGDAYRFCITDLVETNKAIFKGDIYKCESTSGSSNNSYIKKLNIKESDINKVVISHNPSASDTSYVTFFIYTNGEVKYSLNNNEFKSLDALNDYNIKDITHLYCKRGSYETCGGGYKIDIILKDNSNKTLSIKESDL